MVIGTPQAPISLAFCRLFRSSFVLAAAFLLGACGALDDSDGGGSGGISGLWIGDTDENVGGTTTALPTILLLDAGTAYILREDEAQVGLVMPGTNDLSEVDVDIYPYATPDTTNMFFVGVDNSANLKLDLLQANAEKMVLTYNDISRSGRADLLLDAGQVRNVSLNIISGAWKTSSANMDISAGGGFNGWDSATGCQWRGTIDVLSNTLYGINIIREECTEFNPSENLPATGIALIDGTGILHFIVQEQRDFLWMQFEADAAAAPAAPADDAAADDAADAAADDAA